jgi:predicted enzyme related to lactoylglutathione lyase
MPRVIHFEVHASDPDALMAFYGELLDWRFVRQEAMDYWLIETGPKDEPGIDGGLVRRPAGAPGAGTAINAFVCTVQVGWLDETLARATALGGGLALAKMAVPHVGWLAYISDPDGNILGPLQPDPTAA